MIGLHTLCVDPPYRNVVSTLVWSHMKGGQESLVLPKIGKKGEELIKSGK